MVFTERPEFAREYTKLRKRFLSLDRDLVKMQKVLISLPKGPGSKHWSILHRSEDIMILKTRMSCAYLRRDTLRVVYAYLPVKNHIDFIEIYFKGDKEAEDQKRIKEYLSSF